MAVNAFVKSRCSPWRSQVGRLRIERTAGRATRPYPNPRPSRQRHQLRAPGAPDPSEALGAGEDLSLCTHQDPWSAYYVAHRKGKERKVRKKEVTTTTDAGTLA